jgi:hypothetical protein
MFTTGSKLFFGFASLSAVAALLFLLTSGDGQLLGFGTLAGLCLVFLFLGGLLLAFRDANPNAAQIAALSAADAEGGHATPRISSSAWPLLFAFGVLVSAFGLVLDPRVFLLGLVLSVVGTIEWAVQAWADRASDDPAFNSQLRAQIMRPFEFPIFGLVGGAFVVIGFSRIMLAASEHGSVIIFGVVALLVFVSAILVSTVPKAGKTLVSVLLLLGGLGVLAGGVAGAASGERVFEVKTGEEKDGTGTVSDKAGIKATITVQGNQFSVDAPDGQIVLAKGLTSNILFRNTDASKHNLVVTDDKGTVVAQTDFIGQDKATVLTFRPPRAGSYPFTSDGGPVKIRGVITVL